MCVKVLKSLMLRRDSLAQPCCAGRLVDSNEDKEQFRWCNELPKHLDDFSMADAIDDQGLPGRPIDLREDRTTELFPALVNEGSPNLLQYLSGTIESPVVRNVPNVIPETDPWLV